ncbi:MAG: hypothetical protein ACHQVS_01690, partial [Candidatus Babeliales bacterium]
MQHLYKQFSSALTWNALLYTLYKASTTIFSFILFMRLSAYDYATWANINALVFLSILWLDFGLRKSIPRFCPEFSRNRHTHRSFVRSILILQSVLLILATPFFIYSTHISAHTLSLERNLIIFYLATALFVSEGFIAVLRTLYHAHFWNKQFNTVSIGLLTIEMIGNGLVIGMYGAHHHLLLYVLVIKIATSIMTIMICLFMLPRLYASMQYDEKSDDAVYTKSLTKSFIKHSGIMWFNTNIKSLSERNFLVPFITYFLGHIPANIFKVANDGALLMYRMVIKTIGSNDTALLAHVHVEDTSKKAMDNAFKKLTTKITSLCFPLLGIITIVGIHSMHSIKNNSVFLIFFISTIGYLIETVLSPYERILEVHAHYKALIYAYIPYIIMISILYSFNVITFIGLVTMILIIQGVRLVSSLLMVYYAHRAYAIPLPREALYQGVWHAMIIGIPVYVGGYC